MVEDEDQGPWASLVDVVIAVVSLQFELVTGKCVVVEEFHELASMKEVVVILGGLFLRIHRYQG